MILERQIKPNRLPSLNALRAFESAARHRSFKDAASELNVSQSAISHQVKALEEFLSVQLFVRKVRHVELTTHGAVYYPELRDAFNRIANATHSIIESTSQDVLTIQVYSTFTVRWLIPRLSEFETRFPDVQLRLNTAQSDVDFRHSDVDACIFIGNADQHELYYEHLFSSELFPVCSPGFLKKHGPFKSPSDLLGKRLLQVYPSAHDWPVWLGEHKIDGIDLELCPQFDSYDLALNSALQGLGIALGQQPYVRRDLDSGMLVEIFPNERAQNPNHWYFVCRNGSEDHAKIQAFRNWLRQEIENDASLVHLRDKQAAETSDQ